MAPYTYSRSSKRRKTRPKRAFEIAPPAEDEPTYSVEELIARTRVSRRTILNWVRAGLVPKPFFRGPKTRYRRQHLAYILAAKKARGDYLSIDQTRAFIAKTPYEELERYVGLAPREPAKEEPTAPAATAPVAEPPEWQLVELMPGLELYVRNDPVVRRVAHAIVAQFTI